MTHSQFKLIAQRIFKSEGQRSAVAAVIFDGLSSYEAEKRFELPKGTLSRNVRKYKSEVNYITNVAAA
jgi:transposase